MCTRVRHRDHASQRQLPIRPAIRGQPATDDHHHLLFDERGFTNWGFRPTSPPRQLQTIVTQLKYVQSLAFAILTNGRSPARPLTFRKQRAVGDWQLFAVKNDCTTLYISGYTQPRAGYGRLITFPEYSIASAGNRPDAENAGIWERRFSNGLTMVNPYAATATVTCRRQLGRVNGNSVGQP